VFSPPTTLTRNEQAQARGGVHRLAVDGQPLTGALPCGAKALSVETEARFTAGGKRDLRKARGQKRKETPEQPRRPRDNKKAMSIWEREDRQGFAKTIDDLGGEDQNKPTATARGGRRSSSNSIPAESTRTRHPQVSANKTGQGAPARTSESSSAWLGTPDNEVFS